MSKKHEQKIYHAHVNVNSTVENEFQIKSGTTINVGVSVKIRKNVMCAKKIMFGIVLHVLVKIQKVLLPINWLLVLRLKMR